MSEGFWYKLRKGCSKCRRIQGIRGRGAADAEESLPENSNSRPSRTNHISPIISSIIGNGTITRRCEKWKSCAVGSDKCVYGIPWNARWVAKFDPVKNKLTEIGPDLGNRTQKWGNGVLARNGSIYCSPHSVYHESPRFLKIDTITGNVTLLDAALPTNERNAQKRPGALALDGCIYYMGCCNVLKLDPRDDTISTVARRPGLEYAFGFGFAGVASSSDNILYIPRLFVPDFSRGSVGIFKFNPVEQTIKHVHLKPQRLQSIGWSHAFQDVYLGTCIFGRDGYIYAANTPCSSVVLVIKIDIVNDTYSMFTNAISHTSIRGNGWGDPILGNDGCIYWPPVYSVYHILKFDPETKVISLVGSHVGISDEYNRWSCGAAPAPGGPIYCIPYNYGRVLAIDPFKGFVMTLQKVNIKRYPNRIDEIALERAVISYGTNKVYRAIKQECGDLTTALLVAIAAASSDSTIISSLVYHLLRNNPSIVLNLVNT